MFSRPVGYADLILAFSMTESDEEKEKMAEMLGFEKRVDEHSKEDKKYVERNARKQMNDTIKSASEEISKLVDADCKDNPEKELEIRLLTLVGLSEVGKQLPKESFEKFLEFMAR